MQVKPQTKLSLLKHICSVLTPLEPASSMGIFAMNATFNSVCQSRALIPTLLPHPNPCEKHFFTKSSMKATQFLFPFLLPNQCCPSLGVSNPFSCFIFRLFGCNPSPELVLAIPIFHSPMYLIATQITISKLYPLPSQVLSIYSHPSRTHLMKTLSRLSGTFLKFYILRSGLLLTVLVNTLP